MHEQDLHRQALELWRQGHLQQTEGDVEGAIRLYQASLEVHPTAEAHTFLGWAYSLQGRLDEAIAECHKAIALDPDYGNPYNDIGVYLMQRGELAEAVAWLERAKHARRYEPRQFPYINLARIYVRRGEWQRALRELEAAARLAPGEPDARRFLHEILARFN
ncbi:MAG: tetratricopeptide repeat protein [Candidatus Methylomirabilales bacterium]